MKKIIILCITAMFFSCNDKINSVKIEFKKEIEINDAFEHPFLIFKDQGQLDSYFQNSKKSLNKYKHYIEREKFDFHKYDYVFTFGKEILDLTYGDIVTKRDACEYMKRTPVDAEYKNGKTSNFIFVYVISDKGKYRNMCP